MKIPNDGRIFRRQSVIMKGLYKMLGSMYSAVSGLAAHQTKMNVIGNNIANVNTYGFKSSRVTFSDVFYQTISGASAPVPNSTGGTNPTQLGYGAKVNSIDVINTRAGSATTDRAMDIYINGEGYIPVKDADGAIKYTRVGILGFDVSGNLVDSNGNMVLGIPTDPTTGKPKLNADGTVDKASLVPINVPPAKLDTYSGITIGQTGEITAVAQGAPVMNPSTNSSWLSGNTIAATSLYNGQLTMKSQVTKVDFTPATGVHGVTVDSGANIIGDMKISITGAGTVADPYAFNLNYTDKDGNNVDGLNGTVDASGNVSFDILAKDGTTVSGKVTIDRSGATPYTMPTVPATYVPLGAVKATEAIITASTFLKSGAAITIGPSTWTSTSPSVDLGDIRLNITKADFEKLGNIQDGTLLGNVGIGAGVPIKIANLANVKFTNSDGLAQSGEGYFVETANSGIPIGGIPGSQGTGSFRAGALEMSNVDLSREFTEMIITQRGFQANTRMITVSDEMLNELVSMKR